MRLKYVFEWCKVSDGKYQLWCGRNLCIQVIKSDGQWWEVDFVNTPHLGYTASKDLEETKKMAEKIVTEYLEQFSLILAYGKV